MPLVPVKTTATMTRAGHGDRRTASRTNAGTTIASPTFSSTARSATSGSHLDARRPELPQRPREGLGSGQHRLLRPGRRPRETPRRSQCAVGSAARPAARCRRACISSSTPGTTFATSRTATSRRSTSGQNRLADPMLHAYYDRLQRRAERSAVERSALRSIWYLNAGRGPSVCAGIRATATDRTVGPRRERTIQHDAGEQDVAAGVIRSVGRAGYLQSGPGIPMKRGVYRARWVGAIGAPRPGPIGFVDVWAGGERTREAGHQRRRRASRQSRDRGDRLRAAGADDAPRVSDLDRRPAPSRSNGSSCSARP